MKRTIAAILAADVVGYSRMIAQDEEDTLRRLADHGAVYREHVRDFGGRVFNTAGDSILAEFPSAVEALRAAVAIQDALRLKNASHPPERRLAFRMGLTIGDVVAVDGDLLGDGVNIAARLESIADAGGICLSQSVYEAVANKVPVTFRDIGPQKLKNIPRPVHAYRVVWPGATGPSGSVLGGLRGSARRPRRALAAGAVVVVAAGGVWAGLARHGEPGVDRQEVRRDDQSALSVSVTPTRQLCFKDRIMLGGTLVPHREVDVRPASDGLRVLTLAAEPLGTVTAGQVLATLNRPSAPDQPAVALRSPVSGIVGRVNGAPGSLVSAGSPPLFQIIAQGEFDLAAEVPLAELGRIAPGQPVAVTALGLAEVRGQVLSVSVPADAATQSGRVRIQLKEPGDQRRGTFARGIVEIAERCGVGIPSSAVLMGDEGRFVYLVDQDRIEARVITTGLTTGDAVEVRSGLGQNDVVVARAGPFLREGTAIKPIRVDAGRSSD